YIYSFIQLVFHFFIHVLSPTHIYPLSLHDALPISEAEASTSLVNFSELISTIGSPSFTWSPSFTNHLSIVPSVMVRPSFGITISVAIVSPPPLRFQIKDNFICYLQYFIRIRDIHLFQIGCKRNRCIWRANAFNWTV